MNQIIVKIEGESIRVMDETGFTTNLLTPEQCKQVLQLLHDISYDRKSDMFNLPTYTMDEGQKYGVK